MSVFDAVKSIFFSETSSTRIMGAKIPANYPFNIYTKPFPAQLEAVSVSVEGYADDNQLLKKFNLVFQLKVLGEGINETFKIIEQWMMENFLK